MDVVQGYNVHRPKAKFVSLYRQNAMNVENFIRLYCEPLIR